MNKWFFVLAIPLYLTGCDGSSNPIDHSYDPPPPPPEMVINFLPVGQGDAIYIEMPNGQDVLIDGGPEHRAIAELGQIMSPNDRRIDLVILTHPHDDHVEGLRDVIKAYEIGEIWETGVLYPEPDYLQFKSEAKSLGIPCRQIRAGVELKFHKAKLSILAPVRSYAGQIAINLNNTSIVCLLEYGNFTALLTGDAEIGEQKDFVADLPSLDLLKVPHHGASNAAYLPLYETTRPTTAVMTLSPDSKWLGLPSDEALSLIHTYCGEIYRTDHNGLITVASDGFHHRVQTEN